MLVAQRLAVFVNRILAHKTLKITGILLRSYWTWEWQSWKLSSCYILDSIHRSALVIFYGGCYISSVEKKLLLVRNILYSWCRYESPFSIASETCVHLEKQWFLWKICQVKKICTYFVCNTENNLFQVLSSTVSTQAMQKLTGGQEAMKIRPQGKVPHKYFKW